MPGSLQPASSRVFTPLRRHHPRLREAFLLALVSCPHQSSFLPCQPPIVTSVRPSLPEEHRRHSGLDIVESLALSTPHTAPTDPYPFPSQTSPPVSCLLPAPLPKPFSCSFSLPPLILLPPSETTPRRTQWPTPSTLAPSWPS